jgi:hypothetical protein
LTGSAKSWPAGNASARCWTPSSASARTWTCAATLQRIVAAACDVVGARYGALGVIGTDQLLAEFITHGIDAQLHAKIGDLPHGRGVLAC